MSKNASGTSDLEPEERVPILQLDEKTLKSLNYLLEDFKDRFSIKPSFFVKVPGRVNLIGEHIDYCGYAVCPMAIEQHIIIAVAPTEDDKVFVANTNPNYEGFCYSFEQLTHTVREGAPIQWSNYFMSGVQGALEKLPRACTPKGFIALVDGDIPPNAGLSSSSALVSAALLLTMHVNKAHEYKWTLKNSVSAITRPPSPQFHATRNLEQQLWQKGRKRKPPDLQKKMKFASDRGIMAVEWQRQKRGMFSEQTTV